MALSSARPCRTLLNWRTLLQNKKMPIRSKFILFWQDFWALKKRHTWALWTRALLAVILATICWGLLCLLGIAGILTVTVPDALFLQRLAIGVLLLFIVIALSMLAVTAAVETALSNSALARISPARDWRSATIVSLVLLAGLMLGNIAGSAILSAVFPVSEVFETSALRRQLRLLQFLPFLVIVNGIFWRLRLQRQALRAQAAETQLRLLQAQIEPHFLFNTLATIESLVELDPIRARAMLEAFSDHLRAGLAQLRAPETTLLAELAMASNYLRLLQIRMGERLHFSVTVDAQSQAACMPSLLLQPLVENAIRHSLERRVGGGCVHINASVANGRLRIQVRDDGAGLPESYVPSPSGAGIALENIRARLRHIYGEHASLTVSGAAGSTTATIDLPYSASS
jgi:signal transduction histidine kinase